MSYILNGSEYSVSKGTATGGSVVIPKYYNGIPVTTISADAFYNCTGLTSLIIPNSVTSIGHRAFYYCIGLTSITIPNSVISIGEWAFRYCTGLTSVTIGNNVTSIGISAFDYCTGLTSITIPDSVTSIGDCAFYRCTGLTNVIMKKTNAPTLDSYVFDACPLTAIHVPNNGTSLTNYKHAWTAYSNIIVTP